MMRELGPLSLLMMTMWVKLKFKLQGVPAEHVLILFLDTRHLFGPQARPIVGSGIYYVLTLIISIFCVHNWIMS